MATFKKFEEIDAWKLAREISQSAYEKTYSDDFSKDYRLKDQVRGSVGSMMDNVAEGHGRGGQFEFVQFLGYGLGSANEFKSQCYRALDNKYISQDEFDTLYGMTERYSKMVSGLINYLNQTNVRGEKFKNRITLNHKTNPTENHKPTEPKTEN